MTRADQLQQAFAVPPTPDRTAGLVDVLPPRPARAVPPLQVPAGRAAAGSEHTVPGEASEASRSALRGVAVYLPPDLAAWLRRTAATREQTYSDVVLATFETHAGDIPATLDSTGSPAGDGRSSSLFPPSTARRRTTPEAKVQVQLRLTGDELAVIDRLAAQHHAPSRTALVALDCYPLTDSGSTGTLMVPSRRGHEHGTTEVLTGVPRRGGEDGHRAVPPDRGGRP